MTSDVNVNLSNIWEIKDMLNNMSMNMNLNAYTPIELKITQESSIDTLIKTIELLKNSLQPNDAIAKLEGTDTVLTESLESAYKLLNMKLQKELQNAF